VPGSAARCPIHLFSSRGLPPRARTIVTATRRLGALGVLLAPAWAGWLLKRQRARSLADVLIEE